MNFRREFEIAFVGLKPGVHNYEYRVDDKFFSNYGTQDFEQCNAAIKLELDKKSGFMLCGNPLALKLWEEFKVMVKLVDNPEEMNEQEEDPDVYYISRGESHLHLADWIYEFINLSIPLQKMCAPDEIGGPQCNKEVLAKLATIESAGKKEKNSLWKGLDQFKDLK